MKTFDEKYKEILKSLEFSDLKNDVSNFIESLRVLARGYAHWHSNADRYKTLMALDETSRELFLFSVADEANQRYDALQHTLQQSSI